MTDPKQMYRREEVRCYVCDSDKRTPLLEAPDDYTGKPGMFSMVRCADCGLAYHNPRLVLDDVKQFYDENYIAHREVGLGPLSFLVNWAMGRHDVRKVNVVTQYARLNQNSVSLDVGCAAGGYLRTLRKMTGTEVHGVDFKNFTGRAGFENIHFHHGLFYEQNFEGKKFDLITMWHYLEHDYDPVRSLTEARKLLADDGVLVIEVPRLDSLSFRMFGKHWPGVQLPQHTTMLDKKALLGLVKKAGLEVVDFRPYGAFPPGFYLFLGILFKLRNGKGVDTQKYLLQYFLAQIAFLPLTLFQKHLNLCMQTVVCRRPKS